MDQDQIILILIGLVTIILLTILYFIVRKKQQQIPKTQLDNSTHIEITQMEQKPQKSYQGMAKKQLKIKIPNS